MTSMISNPGGAFHTVSDFTTYLAADGQDLSYGQTTRAFVASEAIAARDWVAFVAAAAGNPLRVEKADPADVAGLWVGVALHGAAAGDKVLVVVEGITICNIGNTGAIAAGDYAIRHGATSGASGVLAAASADATTVVGTILGVYLGPEIGTTDRAPVYVHKM